MNTKKLISSDPIISMIIPVYNSEHYLNDCLRSIKSQSYSNFEAIMINDGSLDNSLSICEKYVSKDNRFKLINQINSGANIARINGLSIARGKYVTFVDSDDELDENYLKILLQAIRDTNTPLAVCGHSKEIEEKHMYFSKAEIWSSSNALKEMLKENKYPSALWGKLIKLDIFKGIKFPNYSIGEDLLVNAQLLMRADKISYVPNKLYKYRYVETSITNSGFNHRQLDFIHSYRDLLKLVSENLPELKKFAQARFVRYSVGYLYRGIKSSYEDKKALKSIQDIIKKYFMTFIFSHYHIKYKIMAFILILKNYHVND